MLEVKMIGAETLAADFKKLSLKIRSECALASLVAAANTFAYNMRIEAPSASGALRQSIGMRVRSYAGGKRLFAVIGPRRGWFLGVKPSKYAHVVEFGKLEKGEGHGGSRKGANGFVRRTWLFAKDKALLHFNSQISRRLAEAVAEIAATKAAKKAAKQLK